MSKIIMLFSIILLSGCKLIESRPVIDGYIYSSTDSFPIKDVLIGKVNCQNNSIIVETITDSLGYFNLPSVKKNVFFFSIIDKTHFQFEIFKNHYCMEFVNFNNTNQVQKKDRISIDTIYLKPCIDTIDWHIINE